MEAKRIQTISISKSNAYTHAHTHTYTHTWVYDAVVLVDSYKAWPQPAFNERDPSLRITNKQPLPVRQTETLVGTSAVGLQEQLALLERSINHANGHQNCKKKHQAAAQTLRPRAQNESVILTE
eukprot:11703-Pelagomonas_calceolata.AAC.3